MFDDQGNYIFDIGDESSCFLIPNADEPVADDCGLCGDPDSPVKPSTSSVTDAKGHWNEYRWNDIFENSVTANFLSSLGLDFSLSRDSSLLSSDHQTAADNVDKNEDLQDDPVRPSTSTDTRGRAEQPRKSGRPRGKCTPQLIPTGPGPYECNTCRKKFYWKSNLLKHYYKAQTHDDTTVKKNLVQTHDAAGKNELTAPLPPAKEQLSDMKMLQAVMSRRSNERRQELRCDKCDRVYFHRTHFNYHYRVHTGEKPHACDLCDMKFARVDCLKNHRRIHTGEKPYRCNICKISFSRSGYLRKHTRKFHPN